MHIDLNGKRAIVTGSTAGIGFAIAHGLAESGAAMVKRDWGRIVFISSESGLNIPVEMIHYGMTKTAQLAISRGLAESVAGTGVTVNAVLPGPTRSEGVVDFLAKLTQGQGLSQAD